METSKPRSTKHPVREPRSEKKQSRKDGENYPFYHPELVIWKPCVAFKVLDRGEHGDSPREIMSSVKTLETPLTAISRGKCSELPATLWSNLSVETTHLSRESYSTGQSHGRKSVPRGKPITILMADDDAWFPPVRIYHPYPLERFIHKEHTCKEIRRHNG